jgi:hypothetical protein
VALGNIGGLIRRITTRRKNSQTPDESDSSSRRLSSKGKRAIVLGIAAIGFAGAIYYGSQFVKEEVNGGATLPYTTPSQMKNLSPMDFEIVFIVIALIGFGIFTYGFVGRVDKPLDFYPK